MKKLYDEKGEYIGWKFGKPFWKNHGCHQPEIIMIPGQTEKVVICKICSVQLRKGEFTSKPEDNGATAIATLYNGDRTSFGLKIY